MDNRVVEIELHGISLWIRESDLDRKEGALMPSPNHHIESFGGLLEDSYAHLCADGQILRYKQQIGTVADIVIK